jgi:anti-sigma factor RsiW
MKPCSNNCRTIAWLALGELDARQAATLQEHLKTCAGCRNYLDEICRLTEKLTAMELNPNIHASESFHQKLTARLRAERPASRGANLWEYFRAALSNWRVLAPAAAMLIIGLMIQQRHSRSANNLPPIISRTQVVSTPQASVDLSPTIGNYEMAANQSLDKLDELLARQEQENLPPAPVYTASMLTLQP